MNRIYIGYDPRQVRAYRACIESLRQHSRGFEVHPVNSRLLGMHYQRPESRREGVLWDEISQAPMATEFSIARFFVPQLAVTGWALYCDCDFLWRADVAQLFALADERFMVQCVQHEHDTQEGAVKMDGQVQTRYARKNWSSLMLLNCSRINAECDLRALANTARGLDLHQFKWCPDASIGGLPVEWNWLAGISNQALTPKAVHYTLGTPDLPGYEAAPFADEWRGYANSTRG